MNSEIETDWSDPVPEFVDDNGVKYDAVDITTWNDFVRKKRRYIRGAAIPASRDSALSQA